MRIPRAAFTGWCINCALEVVLQRTTTVAGTSRLAMRMLKPRALGNLPTSVDFDLPEET